MAPRVSRGGLAVRKERVRHPDRVDVLKVLRGAIPGVQLDGGPLRLG
jgi:hypothetical protein